MNTEQLNIEGTRSGSGFLCHKAKLVNALSRALSARIEVIGLNFGRKGLLGYIKALAGSNVVKIVPASNGDSASHTDSKRLKVVCGNHTSYLDDGAWLGDKTPMTFCELRVSPHNALEPNIGSLELAEAISRVLPFTAGDDKRPVLQCVLFTVKDGKLTLASADGFRLAVVKVDLAGIEDVEALIDRQELIGIPSALKTAKRARLSFEKSGDTLDGVKVILDTELIRYTWRSCVGKFPEYEKLIPTDFTTSAHFDTVEALMAVNTLKAVANVKAFAVDIAVNGKVTLSDSDGKGVAEIPAETNDVAVTTRIDGKYLTDALKACGGMVDFKLNDGKSPMVFAVDGFQLVVMPMITTTQPKPAEQAKAEASQPTEPIPTEETEAAQAVAEAEAIAKGKSRRKSGKRNKAKEPVAVA